MRAPNGLDGHRTSWKHKFGSHPMTQDATLFRRREVYACFQQAAGPRHTQPATSESVGVDFEITGNTAEVPSQQNVAIEG